MNSSTIKEKIVEKLSNSSDTIANGVIDGLANQEIDNRIKLVTEAYQIQDRMDKEGRKFKPDVKGGKKADGTAIDDTWSPGAWDTKTKFEETQKKLIELTDKALETAMPDDFKKLKELVEKSRKSGNENKPQSPADSQKS